MISLMGTLMSKCCSALPSIPNVPNLQNISVADLFRISITVIFDMISHLLLMISRHFKMITLSILKKFYAVFILTDIYQMAFCRNMG